MAENKTVTSSRDRYMERLKAKYPDKEFADDEEIFGQINDDYDDYDNKLSGYREREKALSDLIASNPRGAVFLTDMAKGKDPFISMICKYGDDFRAALEDPSEENLEALAQANKEYAERVAEEEQYEVEYQKNITETFSMLEAMQQEEGLSDEDIDSAMDFLVGIVRDGLLGKFTRESVVMALKALKHDSDVAQAEHEGEVRGRNTKIEEKLRKRTKGDGTAPLDGKNGSAARQRPKNIFDLANDAM